MAKASAQTGAYCLRLPIYNPISENHGFEAMDVGTIENQEIVGAGRVNKGAVSGLNADTDVKIWPQFEPVIEIRS